jgi:hydroxymethylglutaryl-CoA lyase
MAESVLVCEVGPRDGLQMVREIMPTEAKLRWIESLSAAGLSQIEVGSFVPPKLVPQMADIEEVVRHSVGSPKLRVIALVPNLKGAQLAYAAGVAGISVPVSVSESHSLANTNKATYDQIAEVGSIVEWVRKQNRAVDVEAGCATAFGCSFEGVVPEAKVVETAALLVEVGADTITLADTIGYAHPAQIRALVRSVREAIGGRLCKLHLHDTMGLGLANVLAGLDEGIREFDSALAGLGGCPFAPGASGNIVTEDLVFMLESMGFDTGIDLEKLVASRTLLRAGLPDEPLKGHVAEAGVPKTFRTV